MKLSFLFLHWCTQRQIREKSLLLENLMFILWQLKFVSPFAKERINSFKFRLGGIITWGRETLMLTGSYDSQRIPQHLILQ